MGKKTNDQQLKATIQKLQTSEEELKAANQQLAASEEELRAANQQMAATEQQLRASNQQLLANEKELKKSQLFANQIANTTPALMYLYDMRLGKNIWTNNYHKEYFKKLTKKYPDMDFKHIAALIHEDDFSKVLEKAQQMNDSPDINNYSLDVRIKSTESVWKWMNLRVSTFNRDKNGKLLQTIGAMFDITERKKAEEKILSLHQLLKETEQTGKIGGWVFDVETMTQTWTEETFRIMEIDTQHGAPQVPDGVEFIDQPYRDMAEKAIQDAIQKGKNYDQEWLITTAKGNKKWVHSVARVHKKSGKVVKVAGSFQDITGKKKAELELKKRNEFIQMILDNFPIGVSTNEIDSNKTTYINPKFAEIYGWPREEFPTVNHFFEKVFPDPKTRMKLQQKIMADIHSGDPERMNWDNLEITTRKGEKRIVHAFNIPLIDQNIMISTVQDITGRKKAQEELQQSEERFKLLSNLTFEGILIHDNGVILDANQSLMNMFGYSREEVLEKNIFQLAIPEKYHQEILGYFQSKSVDPYEIEAVKKDGTHFPIEIVAREVKINEKTFRVAAVRDITERKKAEMELQKYKENLEKLVAERTNELLEKNKELERYNKLFIGREFRIKELRDEIKELKEKLKNTN